MGCPAQPSVSCRWSSVRKKIIFGRGVGGSATTDTLLPRTQASTSRQLLLFPVFKSLTVSCPLSVSHDVRWTWFSHGPVELKPVSRPGEPGMSRATRSSF